MPAEEAIEDLGLDAPDLEVTDDAIDETPSEETEGEGETTEGETETETETTETEAETSAIIDGKKLSTVARAALDKIKTENPRLAGELKSALFAADSLRRAFPGGIKEAQEIQEFVSEFGGREGFQQIKGELDGWHELDDKYMAGDPSFVKEISEINPAAFFKFGPQVFDHYAVTFPEAFNRYVSGVLIRDMYSSGIPLMLDRLGDFVGENPKAAASVNQIREYLVKISQFANAKIDGPAAKVEESPKDNGIREQQMQLQDQKWEFEQNKSLSTMQSSEFNRLTTGRKITSDQKAAISELYQSRLKTLVMATPNHIKTIEKYRNAGDQNGYLQYIRGIHKQVVPKAIKYAVEAIVPGKPGPKVAAKPGVKAPVKAAPANGGYLRVGAPPAANTIDIDRSRGLIQQGKAVLKDGRKVNWR